jgi:hypothetical protein
MFNGRTDYICDFCTQHKILRYKCDFWCWFVVVLKHVRNHIALPSQVNKCVNKQINMSDSKRLLGYSVQKWQVETKVNSEPESLLFFIPYCKQSELYGIKTIRDHLYLSKALVLQEKRRWKIYIIVATTTASILNHTYLNKFNVSSHVTDCKTQMVFLLLEELRVHFT